MMLVHVQQYALMKCEVAVLLLATAEGGGDFSTASVLALTTGVCVCVSVSDQELLKEETKRRPYLLQYTCPVGLQLLVCFKVRFNVCQVIKKNIHSGMNMLKTVP